MRRQRVKYAFSISRHGTSTLAGAARKQSVVSVRGILISYPLKSVPAGREGNLTASRKTSSVKDICACACGQDLQKLRWQGLTEGRRREP